VFKKNNVPVFLHQVFLHVDLIGGKNLAHHGRIVVVAGQTIYRKADATQGFQQPFIGGSVSLLRKVAGGDQKVRRPPIGLGRFENQLERLIRVDIQKRFGRIGEIMDVRKLNNAQIHN
jgi:hypothetical protein